MSRSLCASGRTCDSSSVLFTPIARPEFSSPLAQFQHGFDCCDTQLASETGHFQTKSDALSSRVFGLLLHELTFCALRPARKVGVLPSGKREA